MIWTLLGKILDVLQNFVIWAFSDWKHLIVFGIIIAGLDAVATGKLPVINRRKHKDEGDE